MIFCFCFSAGICQDHKGLIIALAWVQKLSPYADTRGCFVIPSVTTSPVLPLLHSPLTFLALNICSLLCKLESFFSLTSSTKREDHQNPPLQHFPCLGTLVPNSFNHERCLLSPPYPLSCGSPLIFHPHSTLEYAAFRRDNSVKSLWDDAQTPEQSLGGIQAPPQHTKQLHHFLKRA